MSRGRLLKAVVVDDCLYTNTIHKLMCRECPLTKSVLRINRLEKSMFEFGRPLTRTMMTKFIRCVHIRKYFPL